MKTNFFYVLLFASVLFSFAQKVEAKTDDNGSAQSSVMAVAKSSLASISLGETSILPTDQYCGDTRIYTNKVTLNETATVESMSIYVVSLTGTPSMRLGIYDATGENGPGALLAQTDLFVTAIGWNTADIITPVELTAGDYWLGFFQTGAGTTGATFKNTAAGSAIWYTIGDNGGIFLESLTPDPVTRNTATRHWSLYATLTTGGGDSEAPSIPGGLSSDNLTQTSFTLNWTASTDNVGVTGYEVFQDGVTIGTTASTTIEVNDLTSETTYAMTVRARDAVGNWSAQSSPLEITTQSIGTGVNDVTSLRNTDILGNYPNPFNNETKISYNVPVSGQVSLEVFDVTGREISTLVNERKSLGEYTESFTAAKSGMYILRMTILPEGSNVPLVYNRKLVSVK